jgi:hypothetical protein
MSTKIRHWVRSQLHLPSSDSTQERRLSSDACKGNGWVKLGHKGTRIISEPVNGCWFIDVLCFFELFDAESDIPKLHKVYHSSVLFCSRSFTSNSTCKLNVFWHDGDPLGMNSTQVSVFKQAHQIRFGCFLQG